ncbi:MAG TPA: cytochrome P450 [Longimicrobiaceae bacterium]
MVRFRGVPGMYWHVVSHPAGVEHVLRTHQKNYRKPGRFSAPVAALIGRGLLVNESDSWLRQRRLMQPVFHRQRLAGFVDEMAEAAAATAARWEGFARTGETVDVMGEMMRFTLRVVGTTLFSADVSRGADRVGPAVNVALEHISRRMNLPVSLPEWVPTRRSRRFAAAKRVLDEMVYAPIRERRADPAARRDDLLGMLLEARDADTGERMGDEQVRDEVLTLVMAGPETTAASLSWTWHLLARHPEALRALRTELDRVLGGRPPGLDDLARLPYTRAVFDEALRLYPPAWGQPREAVAEDVVGGYRIPAGSLVVVCQWVTHRRPDLWDDPDRFDPERFLGERAARVPPFAYYPFGAGARQCIGTHFALMEAQVALATLAQRFDVRPLPGREPEPDPTFTLRPKGGIPATIHPRE